MPPLYPSPGRSYSVVEDISPVLFASPFVAILTPVNTTGYSTWLEIDLAAVRNNVKQILGMCNPAAETTLSSSPSTALMAVVKADGYGHGGPAIAKAAVQAGATWCGVARLDEALRLRQSGITCRLLVLGFTPIERIPDAIANNVTLTVYEPTIARAYAEKAANQGETLRVHVKVDTGMGRLGLKHEDAFRVIEEMTEHKALELEGVFTHFAQADEPLLDKAERQTARFKTLLKKLASAGIRPKLTHAANSSGTLYFPDSRLDIVRPGIALLGIDPSAEAPLPKGFAAALTWKARLTSKKLLPPGHGISYGHAYITQTQECIGVIPVGYADGFRRVPGNIALIEGHRVPVVGNISMDQTMVRLDEVPQAEIGSEVVLIGSQGKESLSANEHARNWGTIPYEVVCGLADRLPRIYLNE